MILGYGLVTRVTTEVQIAALQEFWFLSFLNSCELFSALFFLLSLIVLVRTLCQ